MRNRYYNPASGQFTQTDPIGLAGGLNLYGYTGGDPVNYSDPFGLFGLCPACKDHFEVSPANEKKIETLNPNVQAPMRQFIREAMKEGRAPGIDFGLRSGEEQDRLYAQGRTAPGPKVTNAKAGQSFHNYGLAIDVYPLKNGHMNFGATRTDYLPLWDAAMRAGQQTGTTIEWGGFWKSPPDMPHFQITGGLSIKDLQGGARP
jgi:uncharacterized protein RhaS with RHS repeats